MRALTQRQLEAVRLIAAMTERDGTPPTVREMGMALGMSSTNSVSDMLQALEKKGLIERKRGKARSIRLKNRTQIKGTLLSAMYEALAALRAGRVEQATRALEQALQQK